MFFISDVLRKSHKHVIGKLVSINVGKTKREGIIYIRVKHNQVTKNSMK